MANKVDPKVNNSTASTPDAAEDSTTAAQHAVAEAPALAMSTLYQAAAHSLGLAMQNAVTAQQQLNVLGQSVTSQAVELIFREAGPLIQVDDLLDEPFMNDAPFMDIENGESN